MGAKLVGTGGRIKASDPMIVTFPCRLFMLGTVSVRITVRVVTAARVLLTVSAFALPIAPTCVSWGREADKASEEVEPQATTESPESTSANVADGDRNESDDPQESILASTEQLEAREEAEKTAQEAASAEQTVREQVKRKKVLEEDISLEQKLLDAARKLSDTLQDSLQADQDALQQKLAAGESASQLQTLQQSIASTQTELDQTRNDIRERTSQIDDLQPFAQYGVLTTNTTTCRGGLHSSSLSIECFRTHEFVTRPMAEPWAATVW